MKVWTDEPTAALQDCSECTDWYLLGDKEAYNTARVRLKAGIKEAKRRRKEIGERSQHHQHQRCARQSRTLQAYKSGAPTSCVSRRCQMSLTPYMLPLISSTKAVKSTPPPEDQPLSVSTADVRRTLLRVNVSKAAGPDNIPGCAFINQLVDL